MEGKSNVADCETVRDRFIMLHSFVSFSRVVSSNFLRELFWRRALRELLEGYFLTFSVEPGLETFH